MVHTAVPPELPTFEPFDGLVQKPIWLDSLKLFIGKSAHSRHERSWRGEDSYSHRRGSCEDASPQCLPVSISRLATTLRNEYDERRLLGDPRALSSVHFR